MVREAEHFLPSHLSRSPPEWQGKGSLMKRSLKSFRRGLGVSRESSHQRAPQSRATPILSGLEKMPLGPKDHLLVTPAGCAE